MADNTNKVTIDAAWFAELYAAKKDKERYEEALSNIAKERDNLRKHIEDDCASCPAVKERDELKARLDAGRPAVDNVMTADYDIMKTRLAVAERCIEDIAKAMSRTHTEMRVDYAKIEDIIRAYRAQKEAK